MKKITIILSILVFSKVAFGQNVFKKFRIDVSAGLAVNKKPNRNSLIYAVEPRFAFSDNLTLGIRTEFGGNGKNVAIEDYEAGYFGEVYTFRSSYMLTGDYYLTKNPNFRPFVGLGLGIYRISYSTSSSPSGTLFKILLAPLTNLNEYQIKKESFAKFGAMVRAGAEFSHLRLEIEYAFAPKTAYNIVNNPEFNPAPSSSTHDLPNSYLGIKVGLAIGGGQKK